MSRLEEVEARLAHTVDSGWPSSDAAAEYRHLCRTLAAEVDARDAVIAEILAMLKPIPEPIRETEIILAQWRNQVYLYTRACEIAGRTE